MIRIKKSIFKIVTSLFFTIILKSIRCEDKMSKDETIALTRDHFGRSNPDEIFYGFIPVWAIVIYILSGFFLVMAVFSGVCYLFGCKNPNKNDYKSVSQ